MLYFATAIDFAYAGRYGFKIGRRNLDSAFLLFYKQNTGEKHPKKLLFLDIPTEPQSMESTRVHSL